MSSSYRSNCILSKKYRHIQRYANKNSLVNTEKGSFYIVKYEESIQSVTPCSKSVYILNISSGEVTKFLSIRLCMDWFADNNMKISYNHVSLLRNARKGHLFKGLYLFSSCDDFET